MQKIVIHNVEQRSPEWHALRAGRVGGSEAIGLTTPARLKTLLYKKAGEILSELEIEEDEPMYVSAAMQRGINLEPEAIDMYIEATGNLIVPAGYVTNSDYEHAGLSPDGLAFDNSCAVEVKCLSAAKHIETYIEQKVPAEYLAQVGWYFFVMPELDYVDFIMYNPDMRVGQFFVITVRREDCTDFKPLYANYVEQLNNIINKIL